jgi:hypothetical protein
MQFWVRDPRRKTAQKELCEIHFVLRLRGAQRFWRAGRRPCADQAAAGRGVDNRYGHQRTIGGLGRGIVSAAIRNCTNSASLKVQRFLHLFVPPSSSEQPSQGHLLQASTSSARPAIKTRTAKRFTVCRRLWISLAQPVILSILKPTRFIHVRTAAHKWCASAPYAGYSLGYGRDDSRIVGRPEREDGR